MIAELQTYQLYLYSADVVEVSIGSLGSFEFADGYHVYTGSARKNLVSRVARHLADEKNMHWHIDYLLAHPSVKIVDVRFYAMPECRLNGITAGSCPVAGFGSSDCIAGCASHLRYQGFSLNYPEEFQWR